MLSENEVLQRLDRLTVERLSICITRSWVRPQPGALGPTFDETDVARLALIVELTEDMEVNDEAVPLILGLLDEVSTLRGHVRTLDAAVLAEGPETCSAILQRIRMAG
ncbi:hypothetical protein FJU08_16855 [Martelella alba]|uniref:Chaperone modulatory protein CbpM n=2 Tax=Aurantimonadaceae TaxID=255475 RepID=A0A506U7P2_9HYPH|nr:hypothetical protein FJU08_16855 [Martelella alba]